ncbi:MAG TPA: ubiquitin-conjugating enzyme E2 [Candidatus Omnitrophota bacterium]|nr:ubiquitin-conjugating enzyme E2 [Candidatus Omnitrophota bacterium]
MPDPRLVRKQEDIEKLRQLQKQMSTVLEILLVEGNPPNRVELKIKLPTAVDKNYPQNVSNVSTISIQLPSNYPIQEPAVTFRSSIWNPNVYPSGKLCIGKWTITENLELLVKRIIQVIVLDPAIINVGSPANGEAAQWYSSAHRKNPALFPTLRVENLFKSEQKRTITWRSIK